ncbi:uncharacterized protein LOC107001107 [Solanum pennellii]|uniref:Uncharacterized protein LOC107001107 n=1 Tax=Solanum pennellii TaxID=28526 RepID=A0ABM1FC88_SOLPN|nr:uncharacterized protein LOC107001107 [Solanum pennellii]
MVCKPIFKLLNKDALTKWTKECQTSFDAIKNYLSNSPVLVPPREGSPLFLYLSVSDNTFGCIIVQHDVTGKKERAIYYISKKFTPYKMDPLKYIFKKAMPIGKLAKWQMLLSEFDIVYVTEEAIKAQALADHLVENPVDEEKKYLAVLVSESGQHYPMAVKIQLNCMNNMAEYEACILGLKMAINMNVHELLVIGDSDLLIHQVQGEWAVKNSKIMPYLQYIQKLCRRFFKIELRHTPRKQNELADALTTISSMIKHPDTNYIDPLDIELREHLVYCSYVEAEPDGLPWYFDIKKYLESGIYPEDVTSNQKKSI